MNVVPVQKSALAVADPEVVVEKAPLSTATINNLPDAAFALIKPGGKKDEDGKTVPRSLRVLPHHKGSVSRGSENTSLDLPRLRNALARLSQTDLTESQMEEARAHLNSHADEVLPSRQDKPAEKAIGSPSLDDGGKLKPAQPGGPGLLAGEPRAKIPPIEDHSGLPTRGVIVSPPALAKAVLDGKKTMIVKAVNMPIGGQSLLLLSEQKAIGVVTLGKAQKITVKRLAALESEHLLTKDILDERVRMQKGWDKGPFYAYPVIDVGVVKTIWSSPAGKKKIANRLVAMLPEHTTYVEPFAGSAAVFFAKKPVKTEVLNDADPDVAQAYKLIKSMNDKQIEKLKKMNWVGSKSAYLKVYDSKPSKDIEKLYRFLYMTHFSYGRLRTRSFNPGADGVPARTADRLATFGPRLRNVKLYSGDYAEVIKKYDSKDTVFFLDPPYAGYNVNVGEKTFKEEEFVGILKSLKGKFLLTYGVRGKLPGLVKKAGFKIKRIRTPRTMRNMRGVGGSAFLTQIIVANYDFEKNAKSVEEKEKAEKAEAAGGVPISKIKNVDTYDPKKSSNAVLKDDFRTLMAWAVSQKADPKRFKHSVKVIEGLLAKLLKEAAERGPKVIQFNPRGLRPGPREVFLRVADQVGLPKEMVKRFSLGKDTDPEDLTGTELTKAHAMLHDMQRTETVVEKSSKSWSTESITNMHARVVDEMAVRKMEHPAPPSDGLDQTSVDFETTKVWDGVEKLAPKQEPQKLDNKRANLRSALKDNPGERCKLCQYFQKPTACAVVVGPVSEDQVCDWIQSREVEGAPSYQVDDKDWLSFVAGMEKDQPYQHKVIDGALTPEGPLVLIEDTAEPPHRFSLSKEFHIGHTSLEHHWTQAEVDRLVAVGKKAVVKIEKQGSIAEPVPGAQFVGGEVAGDQLAEMEAHGSPDGLSDEVTTSSPVDKADKQADPFIETPDEDKTHSYVVQNHWRGKSVHADFRVEMRDGKLLVGFTMNTQIAGVVDEAVVTLDQAQAWTKRMDELSKIDWRDGEWALRSKPGADKPVRTSIQSERKQAHPFAWIDVEGKTKDTEEGKPPAPGATAEFPGVFHIVDQGEIEFGVQKPWFHEYFVRGNGMNYRLMFRQLTLGRLEKARHSYTHCMRCEKAAPKVDVLWADGRGRAWFCSKCLKAWKKEAGKAAEIVGTKQIVGPKAPSNFNDVHKSAVPSMTAEVHPAIIEILKQRALPPSKPQGETGFAGEPAWLAIQPDDMTPNVLSNDAVKKRFVPPLGKSALPKAVRVQVPEEFRYWTKSTTVDAVKTRNALVKAMKSGDVDIDVGAPFKVRKATVEDADFQLIAEKGDFQIIVQKLDKDRRLVTGVVLEPGEVDAQGDTVSEEVIENAAGDFLSNFNLETELGLMHKAFGDIGLELRESWIAPQSMKIGGQKVKKGTWIMKMKVVKDKLWDAVKAGKITGFSIGGVATTKPKD